LEFSSVEEKGMLDEVGPAFIRLTSLLKRLDHSSYSLFIAIKIPVELSGSLALLSICFKRLRIVQACRSQS
jgi:hypothetical protein